jgi:endonuclease YncB( thermonuclease family)
VGGSIGFGRDRPARDLLRELVLGKIVRLERDSLTDDRGRVYVFVDDLLVNAEMVRLGRARVDTSRRFARQPEFARLQKDAQEQGVGIWTSTRP